MTDNWGFDVTRGRAAADVSKTALRSHPIQPNQKHNSQHQPPTPQTNKPKNRAGSSRFLLGDTQGQLSLLALNHDGRDVRNFFGPDLSTYRSIYLSIDLDRLTDRSID